MFISYENDGTYASMERFNMQETTLEKLYADLEKATESLWKRINVGRMDDGKKDRNNSNEL